MGQLDSLLCVCMYDLTAEWVDRCRGFMLDLTHACSLTWMKASGLDGSAATPYGKTPAWTEVIRLRGVMDGPRKGLECVRTCLAIWAGCLHYGGMEVNFTSIFIKCFQMHVSSRGTPWGFTQTLKLFTYERRCFSADADNSEWHQELS